MRTPHESFLLSGRVGEFKSIALSEAFELACDYALLQLQHEQPPSRMPGQPTDPYVGIDVASQMWGARRVIEILKTLHDPVSPPTVTKPKTLNY